MKVHFLIAALSFLPFCSSSQTNNLLFDAYAGFPNTSNYFLYRDQTIDTIAHSDYRVIGTPVSIGIRGESLINTSRVCLGGEINYCLAGYQFDYWDSTLIQAPIYTYRYTSSQLRILLRSCYYFVQKSFFEAYAVAGIGYRYIYRNHSSTDPNHVELNTENSFPWTGRLGVGFRIYPHHSIGIMGEAGVFGGSIFQAGLTFRP